MKKVLVRTLLTQELEVPNDWEREHVFDFLAEYQSFRTAFQGVSNEDQTARIIDLGVIEETVEDIKLDTIVKVHQGSFAFCGASAAVPTGRKITVQGVVYDEGCAICPVLEGPSLSNLAMHGESDTYGRLPSVQ